MVIPTGLGCMDCLDPRCMDHRVGISGEGGQDTSRQVMIEPVQVFKWFPPSRCVTPTMRRLMIIPYVIIAVTVAVLVHWSIDRVRPVRVIDQEFIPKGKPGDQILLTARVERDLDPQCAVDVSRVILTNNGFRFTPEEFTYTREALAESTRIDPDKMRIAIQIPIGAPKGPATIYTTLTYHCNLLDRIWPIRTTTVLKFEVI